MSDDWDSESADALDEDVVAVLPKEIDVDQLVSIANQLDEGPEKLMAPWLYLVLFFLPATIAFVTSYMYLEWDVLFSAITSLAIMNGSINMVIAWLTIRLDGHSNEALDHLETIMDEMDKLEDTLDEANNMVTSFTTDLNEAKELFGKVGVDLNDLDLEPIADVVESLKMNKEDLNEILTNLREVDVKHYIHEAKQIDWDALLAGLNDVMGFIKAKQGETTPRKKISQPINVMPTFDDDMPEDETLDDFDIFDDEEDEEDEYRLMPMPKVNAPKPKLKRNTPKKFSLKRNR